MSGKYTDAQKKASIKYLNEKTDDIRIRVRKGTKEKWKMHAETAGMSLTQFISECVENEISKKISSAP